MCVSQIRRQSDISVHHMNNGTVRTIADLVGVSQYDILCNCYDRKELELKTTELLDFIDKHAVDYFELGDYLFVHGWVPTNSDDPDMFHARKNHTLMSRSDWCEEAWNRARWSNGMLCWSQEAIFADYTIVCGHWHTSWGHHKFHGHKHEFPSLSIKGARESFKPFIEKGIIALDGCAAYSGIVNVAVFEVNDSNNVVFLGDNHEE